MKKLSLIALAVAFASPAFAATMMSDEPPPGSLKAGQSAAYNSRSCSAKNPAKPFKVVRATGGGKRSTVGCFSESDAARQ